MDEKAREIVVIFLLAVMVFALLISTSVQVIMNFEVQNNLVVWGFGVIVIMCIGISLAAVVWRKEWPLVMVILALAIIRWWTTTGGAVMLFMVALVWIYSLWRRSL